MKKHIIFGIAFLLVFTLALFPASALGCAQHENHHERHERYNFTAFMTGRTWTSRVNTSVTYTINTHALGIAIFHLDKNQATLYFMIIVTRIQNITMAHIHIDNGQALGPIIVWLYPREPPPQLIPGKFNGVLAKGKITAQNLTGPLQGMTIKDLVAKMRQGMAYVVMHTSQHPPGEIRGWIH